MVADPATPNAFSMTSLPHQTLTTQHQHHQANKMPPPSQLSIATSSVQRLVKEEASYHKELEKQQARLKNLETNPDEDENAEFQLRQEVFPSPLSYQLVPFYHTPPSFLAFCLSFLLPLHPGSLSCPSLLPLSSTPWLHTPTTS